MCGSKKTASNIVLYVGLCDCEIVCASLTSMLLSFLGGRDTNVGKLVWDYS